MKTSVDLPTNEAEGLALVDLAAGAGFIHHSAEGAWHPALAAGKASVLALTLALADPARAQRLLVGLIESLRLSLPDEDRDRIEDDIAEHLSEFVGQWTEAEQDPVAEGTKVAENLNKGLGAIAQKAAVADLIRDAIKNGRVAIVADERPGQPTEGEPGTARPN